MNIGEKIKRLRTSKFMTQSDLAGDQITRNMLSLIENGSAMPSLPTVVYIAEKLNVPVGFLLAEGDDEIAFRKMSSMPDIKKALRAGDYRICRDICNSIYPSGKMNDDEINLILAECDFGIAKELFFSGKLKASCKYFDSAVETCNDTMYFTEHIKACVGVYYRYMGAISASLSPEADLPDSDEAIARSDEFCRYVFSLEAIENKEYDTAREFVAAFEGNNDAYAEHIASLLDAGENDFESANRRLLTLLKSDMELPEVLLYRVFSDLEEYSKMFADYKSAYEYSSAKFSALEKILSED